MNRDLIEQYAQGGEKLSMAIRGLTREDMLVLPADANVGKWTIQQVVLHLMDADLIWAARMKCIIAEDNPTIVGYDESKFATHLSYDLQDAQIAVQIFDLNRKQFATVLRKLPDGAFVRTGNHNETGRITLEYSVQTMVKHLDHHVKFIHAKRAKMGKEMW